MNTYLNPETQDEINFSDGLNQLKDGLEKIKSAEKLYEHDSWFFDWIAAMEARVNVLKTAAEHELEIKEVILIEG
jgi:hypothetical protein